MPVKCYLLSPRGFCSGVTRAVNMAEQVLKLYGTVYITEDIIHNKMFMQDMSSRGVVKVDSLDEVPNNSTVMFSAHGVSPQVIEKAEKRELTIVDGTCPIVKSIQEEAKKEAELGKKIVIIGNRSHAEIIALLGHAGNKNVFVVNSEMDIDLLPDLSQDEVVYFTQTTLDYCHVSVVVKKLKQRIPHITSNAKNNICYATKERQSAVRAIAKSVDAIIVVGSAHSSNAKRLCEVALDSGIKTVVRLDSKDDLDDASIQGVKSIALTSAASTPDELVLEIIECLKTKVDLVVEDFEVTKENGD